MGARCYWCGEKFGRCYEHAGNCPNDCTFGTHDCDEREYWLDVDDSNLSEETP